MSFVVNVRSIKGHENACSHFHGLIIMLKPAFQLFILRPQPFAAFDFPRWQAVLAVSLIGVLVGLDPSLAATPPGLPAPPLWMAAVAGLLTTWVMFAVILSVLRWWLRRGGRWDGQGHLFHLVAASWLVADTLGAGLIALGIPTLLTLPLWLYAVWVGAQAMAGAIPKASPGYCVAGIVIGLVPAMLLSGLVFGLLGVVWSMGTGVAP